MLCWVGNMDGMQSRGMNAPAIIGRPYRGFTNQPQFPSRTLLAPV